MAKYKDKLEWYSWAILGIIIIVFISIIYAVVVMNDKGDDIVYPLPNATSNIIVNIPNSNGECGDGICQPNEKVGSIIYCGYDCYN